MCGGFSAATLPFPTQTHPGIFLVRSRRRWVGRLPAEGRGGAGTRFLACGPCGALLVLLPALDPRACLPACLVAYPNPIAELKGWRANPL